MKERPILMSGPMVRAYLEGRKTQTRRVCKPQPSVDFLARGVVDVVPQWPTQDGVRWFMADGLSELVRCPHGKPGDRLWVKETFQTGDYAMNDPRGAVYRATDPDWETQEGWKWKPSIFMPRTASRITLDITGVRVERLQEITEEDAEAEGCDGPTHDGFHSYRVQYVELWDSLNAKRNNGTYAWSKNPWVWRIEFPPFSRSSNRGANA